MVDYPGTALKTGAKELLATGLYSDLTIVCGEVEFKVHKFVLHTQSPYFRKLLSGNFEEAAANDNIFRLPLPENPTVFGVLVHHLYHFTYDDSARGDVAAASFAVHVFAAADKYDIKLLRKQAASRLEETLDPTDVQTLIEIVLAVDANTADDVLWDIVIPVLQDNMKALMRDERFRKLLQDMPSLTFKLLELLAEPAEPSVPKKIRTTDSGIFQLWE